HERDEDDGGEHDGHRRTDTAGATGIPALLRRDPSFEPGSALRGRDDRRTRFQRTLVLALRLVVELGHALAARRDPGAEPDRELAADDERGDRERREQLVLHELLALAGRELPERRLEELAEDVAAVGGDADEQPEDDPVAPATAVDDGTEQPERDEEHHDRHPQRERGHGGGQALADVLAGDVAGGEAQAERDGEVEDAEDDRREQADAAGGAPVAARARRLGGLHEDRLLHHRRGGDDLGLAGLGLARQHGRRAVL